MAMLRSKVVLLLSAGLRAAAGGSCDAASLCPATAGIGLLQLTRFHADPHLSMRQKVTENDLIELEAKFTHTSGDFDHGDMGGDRMPRNQHNYAPIYSKYLSAFLSRGERPKPKIVETGILQGSGLAMWTQLFPTSRIYGFDINTSSFERNRAWLQGRGMDDSLIRVNEMDQMNPENVDKLRFLFGQTGDRPNVLVDDGYHMPEAGWRTFLSFRPVMADRFVYFIEDVRQADIRAGLWKDAENKIMEHCNGCSFNMECPQVSNKPECIAVIHKL